MICYKPKPNQVKPSQTKFIFVWCKRSSPYFKSFKPENDQYIHRLQNKWFVKNTKNPWGCPRGVMVKVLHCRIIAREFELHSLSKVHFRINALGKGVTPLSSHIWVKKYHYCPSKKEIDLALNNPRKFIYH